MRILQKIKVTFLFTLPKKLLSRLLFPIGHLNKEKVREIALKNALPVFNKKDSTGVCFIGQEGYRSFIENYASKNKFNLPKEGLLRSYPTGDILGKHQGIHHFTIGQRKGLGISSNKALFVVKIDKEKSEVWLGEETDLYSHTAKVTKVHWLDKAKEGEKLYVKVRFHDKGSPAYIYKNEDSCFLKFITPKKALTPGQSAVFYRDQQVLGGGTIQLSS